LWRTPSIFRSSCSFAFVFLLLFRAQLFSFCFLSFRAPFFIFGFLAVDGFCGGRAGGAIFRRVWGVFVADLVACVVVVLRWSDSIGWLWLEVLTWWWVIGIELKWWDGVVVVGSCHADVFDLSVCGWFRACSVVFYFWFLDRSQIYWDLKDSFWVANGFQICWDLKVSLYLIELYCISVDCLEAVCKLGLICLVRFLAASINFWLKELLILKINSSKKIYYLINYC
jgi:hypothetical protein